MDRGYLSAKDGSEKPGGLTCGWYLPHALWLKGNPSSGDVPWRCEIVPQEVSAYRSQSVSPRCRER